MNYRSQRCAKRRKHSRFTTYGKVSEVVGLLIKVEGLAVFIGEICEVALQNKTHTALAEVVGFVKNRAPDALDQLEGIGPGCLVRPTGKSLTVKSMIRC